MRACVHDAMHAFNSLKKLHCWHAFVIYVYVRENGIRKKTIKDDTNWITGLLNHRIIIYNLIGYACVYARTRTQTATYIETKN